MKDRLVQRMLWIVMLGLFSASMNAQKLKVTSFVQDATDLTARKDMARQDRNGDFDGLVKVQMVQKGVRFETNMVDTVVERTSEYWVFMYKGAKKLTVKHPDYLPLEINFREYGFRSGVAEKTTYIIRVEPEQEMDTNTGKAYLSFKAAIPVECTISVTNGDLHESRQTDGNGEIHNWHLPYGTYHCHIISSGYREKDTTVVLSREPVNVNFRLIHATGTLTIIRPLGASVSIHPKDDALIPSTLAASTGEVIGNLKGNYEVTVSKHGFVPKTKTIEVRALQDCSESFTLRPTVDRYMFINYSGSPHAPFGLMFGSVKRWGWYAAIRTSARALSLLSSGDDDKDVYGNPLTQTLHYQYEHLKHIDGQVDYSGFTDKGMNQWNLTAGAVYRAARWGFVFVGAGYGVGEHLYLDETRSELYTNMEHNGQGAVTELGMMVKLGSVLLLGGYQLRFAKEGTKGEPVFGLGFTINLNERKQKKH